MTVSVAHSFQRSVSLIRDFYGPASQDDYIVTTKARQLIQRIVETLTTRACGHAWSVTGPYGSGKSSFALFLAQLLRSNAAAHSKLADADSLLERRLRDTCPGVYCPILVVGSRESIEAALVPGLVRGITAFDASLARNPSRSGEAARTCRAALRRIIDEADAAASQDINDEFVVDLYQRTAAAVHSVTGGGILLIVDELGKLLEYASLYPERSDLYVLQRLAELASGRGLGSAAPLLVFTILHQAFDRYAGHMSSAQRNEWRKVQGRFEDFAFVEPISETLRLLACAVRVDNEGIPSNDELAAIDKLLELATFPAGTDLPQVRRNLASALPLDPAVSLMVGPLFRRLAQNRRSLFAFLGSGEPGSFLDVLGNHTSDPDHPNSLQVPRYRLDHLYNYLIGAVGAASFNTRVGHLWAETESVIVRIKDPNKLAVRCIKHIALLSFAGPLAGLPPTTGILRITTDAASEVVDATLESLREARLIVYRPFSDEYRIWQGSDFDLDSALQQARAQLPLRMPLASMLAKVLPPMPIVARRHSFRTGTTRIFQVTYASDETWPDVLNAPCVGTDGRIVYVLPEQGGASGELLASIQEFPHDAVTLVALPAGIKALRELVREVACLEWVRDNSEEMRGDGAARREIDQQFADLSGHIEQRLVSLLAPKGDGQDPCTWIHAGKSFRLQNGRDLQDKLSKICDEVFDCTPVIWNELLNCSKPSSSAIKGLKRLLVAMLDNAAQVRLSIRKFPAEYGMYASILQATGIHRPTDHDSNQWHFARPDPSEHSECAAVWNTVTDMLKGAHGRRVSVREIHEILQNRPFGMRKGLIPVFLIAIYKSAEEEIAIYESGTYVSGISFAIIERFLKSPENFEMQWVAIAGAKAEVLQRLAPIIGLSASVQRPLPFVLRLLKYVHSLTPYARRTAALSRVAINVREALHHAIEPATLLFEDLPEACGVDSFLAAREVSQVEVQLFVERLQKALRELGGIYDTLLADLQSQIAHVFRLRSDTPDGRRRELVERASLLLPYARGTKFRGFLVRVTDEILDTRGWYESLATLLAKKPPAQWTDEDSTIFGNALRGAARRFSMLEPIAFEVRQEMAEPVEPVRDRPTIRRVRLSVTVQYEDENEQVISIHPEDSELVQRVYQRLEDEISKEHVTVETKIAALAQLSHRLLIQRERAYKTHG
ncbi:MAG: hypothetical protein OXM02_07820 [Bacteroidota bacterium]|nr:hypothetical protein [Bacteroidota bacterium]